MYWQFKMIFILYLAFEFIKLIFIIEIFNILRDISLKSKI